MKKKLCIGLGAEKWVDFKESKDLVKDVQDATDGLGPDAALIAAGDVRYILILLFTIIFTRQTDNSVQPSNHVFTA